MQVACSVVVVCLAVTCSVLPFILQGKQSDKSSRRIMSLPWRKLYKCMQVASSVVVVCLAVTCSVLPFILQGKQSDECS